MCPGTPGARNEDLMATSVRNGLWFNLTSKAIWKLRPGITNLWYDMCGFHTKPFHWFFYVGFWSLKGVRNPFWNHQAGRRFRPKGPMWPPAKKGLKYRKAKGYAYAPRRIRGWVYICQYMYINSLLWKVLSGHHSELVPSGGLKLVWNPREAPSEPSTLTGERGGLLDEHFQILGFVGHRWKQCILGGNMAIRDPDPCRQLSLFPPIWMIRC